MRRRFDRSDLLDLRRSDVDGAMLESGIARSHAEVALAKKKALITGITGQDGAYLAEFLLAKGYVGPRSSTVALRSSTPGRIDYLYHDPHETGVDLTLHHGDLTDSSSLTRIIQEVQPDEIYNLAAQSHVAVSFEEPEYTANADALGALRLLEAIRILGLTRPDALLSGVDVRTVRARAGNPPEAKRRLSTPARPMRPPSSMPTGSR